MESLYSNIVHNRNVDIYPTPVEAERETAVYVAAAAQLPLDFSHDLDDGSYEWCLILDCFMC